jgi:hypothetical protein
VKPLKGFGSVYFTQIVVHQPKPPKSKIKGEYRQTIRQNPDCETSLGNSNKRPLRKDVEEKHRNERDGTAKIHDALPSLLDFGQPRAGGFFPSDLELAGFV